MTDKKLYLYDPDGSKIAIPLHDNGDGTFSPGIYNPSSGGTDGGPTTVADGADVAEGARTDAASSSTVASNAASESGISLWKGIKNILILLSAVLGVKTGAAVTTDADGTLQQYLRGLVKVFADVWNSTVHAIGIQGVAGGTTLPVTATPAASELHLGEIGGKGVPITVNFARPADATPYSQYDNVGVNLAVTGATNATPIVVTTAAHGLHDGDYVTIAGCVGNTAANGSFYVKNTGYLTTTFALYSDKALATPVVGNGAWTSGGTVARLFRIPGFFRKAGGSGLLLKVSCTTNNAAWVSQHQLWLYNAPVPAILDNIEKTALWANTAQRMGPITMPAFVKPSTNSDCTICLSVPGDGVSSLPLAVHNGEIPADVDLWFMVSLPLATPGTPASAQQFTYKFYDDSN